MEENDNNNSDKGQVSINKFLDWASNYFLDDSIMGHIISGIGIKTKYYYFTFGNESCKKIVYNACRFFEVLKIVLYSNSVVLVRTYIYNANSLDIKIIFPQLYFHKKKKLINISFRWYHLNILLDTTYWGFFA